MLLRLTAESKIASQETGKSRVLESVSAPPRTPAAEVAPVDLVGVDGGRHRVVGGGVYILNGYCSSDIILQRRDWWEGVTSETVLVKIQPRNENRSSV